MTKIRYPKLPSSEITSEEHYYQRRAFIQKMGYLAGSLALPTLALAGETQKPASPFDQLQKSPLSTTEKLTPESDVTTYNNFYEFGLDKSDPARHAHTLRVEPWSVQIEGLCEKPQTLSLDQLLHLAPLEERIYRMRCVEGWSMVIPWVGLPLSALIKHVAPLSSAKYVEFISLSDSEQMPGVSNSVLNWPYREALRIDEANNDLTLLAVGLYGKSLPAQNGAPIRLVVPWKYGFKGIKSIVKIRFSDRMPTTSWVAANPQEYGFYANVAPQVPHPRWSQAKERRIGEFRKRETLLFNGYAEQVAHLYTNLDLVKNY